MRNVRASILPQRYIGEAALNGCFVFFALKMDFIKTLVQTIDFEYRRRRRRHHWPFSSNKNFIFVSMKRLIKLLPRDFGSMHNQTLDLNVIAYADLIESLFAYSIRSATRFVQINQ